MIGFWSHHQVAPKRYGLMAFWKNFFTFFWYSARLALSLPPYSEDRRRLGNANKKLRILFGVPLALHYLCHCIAKIGFGSGMQTKNFVFCLVFRSPCTIFARCEDTDPLTNVS